MFNTKRDVSALETIALDSRPDYSIILLYVPDMIVGHAKLRADCSYDYI